MARVLSAASKAKNLARGRQWRIDNPERYRQQHIANREQAKAARRARRAEAREMTNAEKSADGAYVNWLELEHRIRRVVAAAITEGTIERGSRWYGHLAGAPGPAARVAGALMAPARCRDRVRSWWVTAWRGLGGCGWEPGERSTTLLDGARNRAGTRSISESGTVRQGGPTKSGPSIRS